MPDIGSYLFNVSPGEPDVFTYVAGGIFLIGLALGLTIHLRRHVLFAGSPALMRLAGQVAMTSIVLSAFGVLFFVLAVLQVPLLASRFWLAGLLLVGLILFIYLIYYLRAKLPPLLARYRQEQMRQQYMPRPTERRSAKKKGKKRK